ncbi:MAG: hypothetical protein ABFD91_04110 [Anaerohalosphaeraceae bacterium]
MKCQNCQWYQSGDCYFNPPSVVTGLQNGVPKSVRPAVKPDDFCSNGVAVPVEPPTEPTPEI